MYASYLKTKKQIPLYIRTGPFLDWYSDAHILACDLNTKYFSLVFMVVEVGNQMLVKSDNSGIQVPLLRLFIT